MITFLSICLGCSLYGLAMLFGGDHGDVDTSDVGGDADGGMDHPDGHMGDHGPAPAIFSMRTFLLFGVGFGGIGAIARHFGMSMFVSSLFGLLGGVFFAAMGWYLFRFLYKQESSTTTNTFFLSGKKAIVTIRIPVAGIGQIRAVNEYGTTIYLIARSNEYQGFNEGEEVTIESAEGNTATVKK